MVFKARPLTARFGRPVMITEVGYPSVAHAHVGPWDFRTDKPFDLDLQNFLLKGALPDKYAERRQVSGPDGGPMEMDFAAVARQLLSDNEQLSRFSDPLENGNGKPRAICPPSEQQPLEVGSASQQPEQSVSPSSNGNGRANHN